MREESNSILITAARVEPVDTLGAETYSKNINVRHVF